MKNNKMPIYYILFFIALIAFLYVMFSSYLFDKKPDIMYFENKDASIHLDDKLKLNVFVEPLDDYNLVYESDNPLTLRVDDDGTVTGLRMGTATITVKVKRHPEMYDTCRVVVMDARIPVTKITLGKTDDYMFVGTSQRLTTSIEPKNASNKVVLWESSNPKVATVSTDGKVSGLSKGKVTITATTLNGHKASRTFDVVTEKIINVKFVIQDKKITSSNDITQTCKITKDNRKCTMSTPKIIVNNGYEFIGWNSDKKATTNSVNNLITVTNDSTYYSITKNNTPLTATYVSVNDTVDIATKTSSCYLYNGNTSCSIKLVDAIGRDGNKFIGWSTTKNSTSVNYKNNTMSIDRNFNLYSIAKKTITITYNANTSSANNIKADKLLFTSNQHTKCESYNGNGCSISWVPAIYSKGHVIHGFSQTPDGKCISVFKTKFYKDTTLYARVYDTLGGKRVSPYSVSYEETFGNIPVEVEYGISSTVAQQFINFVKKLYKDHPELFYFNGKMALLTESTYVKYNGRDSAGVTWTDDYGYFSMIYIRYNSSESTGKRFLGTTVHEMGHGYNNLYDQVFGKHVSSQSDVAALYEKYKYSSRATRPLSDYAYGSSKSEFFSEALLEVYRYMTLSNGKEYYRSEKPSVTVTSDIKNVVIKYLNNGKSFFKKIGRIS